MGRSGSRFFFWFASQGVVGGGTVTSPVTPPVGSGADTLMWGTDRLMWNTDSLNWGDV